MSSAAERSDADTKYKGVRKRTWGKYVSEIRLPNSRERIWLGSYDSAKKAARAFDAALFCLRGTSARFNFPDNPPDIPGGRSLNASEIQAAAYRFANRDIPDDSPSLSSLGSEMQAEPESPPAKYDTGVDGGSSSSSSFWNEFTAMGSTENNIPTSAAAEDPFHSAFPEFDDFSNDYFIPPPDESDYMEENNGESSPAGLFLWNF